MLLPAAIAASLLLAPSVATTWIKVLRSENRSLLREVEKLELDQMVRQYQAGESIRVAGIDGASRKWREFELIRRSIEMSIRSELRQGRTSPEAFFVLLAQRATVERMIRQLRWPPGGFDRDQARTYKLPWADPDWFPELADIVSSNYQLKKRHQLATTSTK